MINHLRRSHEIKQHLTEIRVLYSALGQIYKQRYRSRIVQQLIIVFNATETKI